MKELLDEQKNKLLCFLEGNASDLIYKLCLFIDENEEIKNNTKPFTIIINQIAILIVNVAEFLKEQISDDKDLEKVINLILEQIKHVLNNNMEKITK